ncbi:hypothetical protein ABPG77_005954 [Micractinium sp. CCAP 211/92]
MLRNAFDLLADGGGQPAAVASKSKKKSKKKGGGAAIGEAIVENQPLSAPGPETQPVQSAKDAGEALEAAAVAAGPGELGSLAADWAEQLVRSDEVFTDGKDLVEFRQVLLSSRALEALFEAACARGSPARDAQPLAQLLGAVAHASAPAGFAVVLADAAASLGQLAAVDPLAPTPAAKRAVCAALGLLKRGIPRPPQVKPAEAPDAKLRRLAGELGRQEARLGGPTPPKELGKIYASILELLCGQLDVLRPGRGAVPPPQAPELAAALRALEDLQAALAARLQEVQAPPKPKLSVEQQVAEAEAAHRREDAAKSARLGEVETRIASLEAELAALRAEAAELRERRASSAQHHKARLAGIRSGKPAAGASPAEIAAALQGGLGALTDLSGAVRAGGAPEGAAPAADAAALAAEVVAAEVPVKLLGAMQQVVELSLQQLAELGGKARFYRERLEKAVKQGEQAAKLGVGDPKTFQQQRTTAEKNVKDVLAASEAAAAAARAAVAAYRERLPAMLCLPSFMPPPPEYLSAMESRAAEAEAILQAIKAGTYVGAAAAAQPAAQPAGEAAASAGAAEPAAAAGAAAPGSVSALETRLAALEAETQKKDAQIAALVNAATLDVPSPLSSRTSMPPAMLSSPTSNKPTGPAAPIAPAPGPAGAPRAPISFSQAVAGGAQANGRRRA